MQHVKDTVDAYIAAWNTTDDGKRLTLVGEAWADEGAAYVDPLASGEGHEQINTLIGAVQQQFAGHRFELSAEPNVHNDRVRFSWRLYPQGSDQAVAGGTDFATLAEDGRLRIVTGFLDEVA